MNFKTLNISLYFFLLQSLAFFNCQTVFAKEKQPIQLQYGIFIKKIVPDFKSNTFYTEFFWWVRFKNDTLKTKIPNSNVINLQYVNACHFEDNRFQDEIEEGPRLLKDGSIYYEGYHQGDFFFNPDYSYYPFDEQNMDIEVEHALLTSDQICFITDSTSYISSGQASNYRGLSADLFRNVGRGYRFIKTDLKCSDGIYNTNFGDPDFKPNSVYSRITTSIFINRSIAPYISKLMIPIAIILLLVYFVFFIPAEKIDIAAGLTVTSLLSAIAFQLSVAGDLPNIGYIIYIDKVFYTCYLLIALSMAESLWTFYLDDSGEPNKIKMAVYIDYIARFLFPAIFLASLFLFALI